MKTKEMTKHQEEEFLLREGRNIKNEMMRAWSEGFKKKRGKTNEK